MRFGAYTLISKTKFVIFWGMLHFFILCCFCFSKLFSVVCWKNWQTYLQENWHYARVEYIVYIVIQKHNLEEKVTSWCFEIYAIRYSVSSAYGKLEFIQQFRLNKKCSLTFYMHIYVSWQRPNGCNLEIKDDRGRIQYMFLDKGFEIKGGRRRIKYIHVSWHRSNGCKFVIKGDRRKN